MPRASADWLADGDGSVFEGVSDEELAVLLAHATRSRFVAGSVVFSEGEMPPAVYAIESGSAEVVVRNRTGEEKVVATIVAGTTFGEMSLLTGNVAAATVRVTEDMEVLVIARADFERFAERCPRLYRNLAEILSHRLAKTTRAAANRTGGRVTLVRDLGSPPLLAYALAASIAWHSGLRTLLVRVADEQPEVLERLADGEGAAFGERWAEQGVDILLVSATDAFAPDRIERTLDEIDDRYQHVLLVYVGDRPSLPGLRALTLVPGRSAFHGGGEVVRAWTGSDRRAPRMRGGVLDVPEPTAVDEERLRSGVLPNDTPAGRALGRLARDLAGLKVGLALGAGGGRGYAHYGVLSLLERIGLVPDYIAGCSIGSSAAMTWILGRSPAEGVALMDQVARVVFKPTVPVYSLLSSRGVRNFVREVAGDARIEDLEIPLAVVVADLRTRREIVIRRGPLWQAVVASMAIPGIYPAQRIGDWVLVDGGVIDPVPVRACADMGADVVVGVRLGLPTTEPLTEATVSTARGRPPTTLRSLIPALEIMQDAVAPSDPTATTILISPELTAPGKAGLRNFAAAGRVFYRQGVEAAEAALPRLTAALPWLRQPVA